ncbi:MAG: hypothetical protein HYU46_03985 [Deltaproteobacteria bacterium]|nr:hypothetical protein [Deltaproteobacteria bacterium]MBI2228247.1 hypothetical protein [Deltaproteobacteria bacterium]
MLKRTTLHAIAMALALLLTGLSPSYLRAEDALETAGVATGVSAGNMWFIPAKAVSVSIGALTGALSFLLTGNADLTKQIWEDTLQGPYAITPDVAKQAVGDRPELREKK